MVLLKIYKLDPIPVSRKLNVSGDQSQFEGAFGGCVWLLAVRVRHEDIGGIEAI